jgi:hypothetical protein
MVPHPTEPPPCISRASLLRETDNSMNKDIDIVQILNEGSTFIGPFLTF